MCFIVFIGITCIFLAYSAISYIAHFVFNCILINGNKVILRKHISIVYLFVLNTMSMNTYDKYTPSVYRKGVA